MKNRFLSFFILLTTLSFSQKIVKIDNVDLDLFVPKNGMIVKKADGIYRLEIQYFKEFRFVYTKVDPAQFETLKTNPANIYKNDIAKGYDFDNLRNVKFSYFEDEDENYFFLFNDFLLASFTNHKEDEKYWLRLNDISPYIIIEINKLRFLYYFDENTYMIPTKKEIKLISSSYDYLPNLKIEKHKISAEEIILCSNRMDDDYIEPENQGQKYQLKNRFNQIVITKKYDSIFLRKAIICYSNKRVDLYNYQYKKLNHKPIEAFKVYENVVQFIENNKLLTLDFNGISTKTNYFQKYQGPYMPDGTQSYFYNLQKNEDGFYLYLGWSEPEKTKLINTDNIRNIYFPNNQSNEYGGDFYSWSSCPLYFQLNDGSYGIGRLEQFINTEYADNDGYYTNYQNLQDVKAYQNENQRFKLKKNNLFMFYPLQQKQGFRYKILEDFNGYFSRFELPNGKKGWLDREGKEYLDQ